MDLKLTDKVMIVTGGDKGIGGAISEILAEEGAIVVIAGRKQADGEKKVAEIKAQGGQADFFQIELQDGERRQALVDYTLEKYGRIDGVFNNAGVNDSVSLEHGTEEAFIESYQKNMVHVYSLVQKCLPALIKSRGTIINIGSKVATTGQGGTSGYAASKGAMNALTREWAVELAKYSIRVNTVIPAEVWTPMYDRWIHTLDQPEERLKEITSRIPLERRFTTSEEIGNMAVFLASNAVSGHTTGQIVYVDGGYTHLDRAYNS